MKRRFMTVGVLVLGSLAACAGAGRAPAAAPGAAVGPIPEGDGPYACMLEGAPAVLPAAAELFDTVRLGPRAAAVFAGAERTGGHLVFSLEYDAEGTNVRRSILEHSVTPVMADSLQKLLFASLAPVEPGDEPWGVRMEMRMEEGNVGYQVGHRVYCPPRPRNPGLEAARYEARSAGVRYRRGGRERVVIVRARIHPAGYIAGGRVLRGADSGGTLERELVEFVRRYSFFPATIDGQPVVGETDIPVIIQG